MKPVITSQQMKDLDAKTISDFGIPSRVLMETAGKGCADLLQTLFNDELTNGAVVLCGSGNNGGDGYVIARWLDYYGYDVVIITTGKGKSSPETIANLDLCKKLQIEFIDITDEDYEQHSEEALLQSGVIIDAVYGIGFKGALNNEISGLILKVNNLDSLKVAIDIPSGVNADSGAAELAFMADITLTMEAMKYGHVLGRGRLCSGFVEVIPIGIPDMYWEDIDAAVLLDESIAHLPDRDKFSHKGDYGRIAIFAGAVGFTGAAFLSSLASVKAGAGLVTIFAHPENISIYDNKPYEVMVREIPLLPEGKIDRAALNTVLEKYDVILFGPGCTVSDFTLQILRFILDDWNKSAVIDADGLNTLAKHPELYNKLAQKPIVLTPHWGEFCRLAEISMEDLKENSVQILKDFVSKHQLKVLLKSATSVYCDDEITYINTRGNDGLATGGSGDVLSGLIAGFLAQKMTPADAAGMASYYLGLTAERLAEKQDTISIIPTDILENIFKYEQIIETGQDEE